MRLFGIRDAEHYCSSFSGNLGDALGSIESFRRNQLSSRSRILREGTQLFNDYKDCSLRDVERCLFFAASHYRRSLDLMISSSAPWAYVTVYYGCWFASRALLGMFGCTIFSYDVIDVEISSPGQQKLKLRRIGNMQGQQPSTYRGTHKIYWDLFYQAVRVLRPIVQTHLSVAITPVGNNPVWQIERRNEINYNSLEGIRLVNNFQSSFAPNMFPSSLPGILATQFGILEALIELTFGFASKFSLNTDALNIISGSSILKDNIRDLIYNTKSFGLVRKTKKHLLV